MTNNKEYNFFQMGAEFGSNVAKCSEPSIISLLAERIRMVNANCGIKAAAEYRKGALTAIAYSNKIENEVIKFNNQVAKAR